jgi:hypothetical protein
MQIPLKDTFSKQLMKSQPLFPSSVCLKLKFCSETISSEPCQDFSRTNTGTWVVFTIPNSLVHTLLCMNQQQIEWQPTHLLDPLKSEPDLISNYCLSWLLTPRNTKKSALKAEFGQLLHLRLFRHIMQTSDRTVPLIFSRAECVLIQGTLLHRELTQIHEEWLRWKTLIHVKFEFNWRVACERCGLMVSNADTITGQPTADVAFGFSAASLVQIYRAISMKRGRRVLESLQSRFSVVIFRFLCFKVTYS